jgi:two-component system nitrogen regulation response regulator GlnG
MSEPDKTSARAHVLIVEDSSVFREMQGLLLRQAGYAVSGHEHPQAALAAAKERAYDLVIIDYELPGMNGEQFMHALRKILPDVAVIFVSGSLTLELAIQLSRQGVAGIFNKPANPKTLLEKINETLSRTGSRDAAMPGRGSNSPLPAARRGNSNSPFATITAAAIEPVDDQLAYAPQYFFGRSESFRDLTHRLWKVRDFRAVLLLQGEEGSPFELLARDLAEISIFRNGPVMVCDAARFEAARLIEVLAPSILSQDAGTLVVTGVETFTTAQQKVLENLITGRDVFLPFARRFRLVLAAAANLSELADSGIFNETLYYKISSLSLSIPAFCEMSDDIPVNARHLLEDHCAATNAPTMSVLDPAAEEWLKTQAWPGNHTQLSRVLIAAARHAGRRKIDVPTLEASLRDDEENSAKTKVPSRRTRSPFSPSSGVAKEPVPVVPIPANAPSAVSAAVAKQQPLSAPGLVNGQPHHPDQIGRATTSVASLTTRSVFRPASGTYDFSKRLAASLALADASAAS